MTEVASLVLSVMARKLSRRARCEKLYRSYLKYTRGRIKRSRRRLARQRKNLHLAGLPPSATPESVSSLSSPDSDLSSDLDSDTSDTSSTSSGSDDTDSSDIAGSSEVMDDLASLEIDLYEMEMEIEEMPELLDIGDSSDDESDSESDDDSGNDGDEEEEEDVDMGDLPRASNLARGIREAVESMYASRYEEPRDRQVPRPPPQLRFTLDVLKHEDHEQFREILRINPETFDTLVREISDDPVFTNNSNNSQIPVEEQIAIALYRFGHDGNAASQSAVSRWAGSGKGSPALHTKRVMTAILRPSFTKKAIRLPTPAEKAAAKAWVEAHSCRAWRDGWLFVDGTLIPLYDRPYWYGESYFDRKCNYSMNVQVSTALLLRNCLRLTGI